MLAIKGKFFKYIQICIYYIVYKYINNSDRQKCDIKCWENFFL